MRFKLLLVLLLVACFFFITNVVRAQNYDSVTEKIHYTFPNRKTKNTAGDWVPIRPLIEIGSTNPKTTIYIYADMQTQYSQLFFRQTFSKLLSKYQDSIQFVYQHNPFLSTIESHIKSEILVQCIADQNQFWQNLNLLMDHISDTSGNYDYLNNGNGFDQTKLKDCLADPISRTVVVSESEDATLFGLSAVPTFIIQDDSNPQGYSTKVLGAQDISIFDEAIKETIGYDPEKATINQLQAKIATQSQELAQSEQKVSFLQTELNNLEAFVNQLLHFLHLK